MIISVYVSPLLLLQSHILLLLLLNWECFFFFADGIFGCKIMLREKVYVKVSNCYDSIDGKFPLEPHIYTHTKL